MGYLNVVREIFRSVVIIATVSCVAMAAIMAQIDALFRRPNFGVNEIVNSIFLMVIFGFVFYSTVYVIVIEWDAQWMQFVCSIGILVGGWLISTTWLKHDFESFNHYIATTIACLYYAVILYNRKVSLPN